MAVYPHLTKPDTKWKKEGEFRVKIKYDAATAEAIRAKLIKLLDEAFEKYKELLTADGKKAKVKTLSKADLPLKAEVDEEGEETGFFLLNTKRTASGINHKGEPWTAKIVIADALGKPVGKKGLAIWSGTELRVSGTTFGWYGAKDNEVGVSIDIDGVQIKKLVSGGDRDVNFDAIDDEGGWTPGEDADTDSDDADTDAADSVEDGDTPDF